MRDSQSMRERFLLRVTSFSAGRVTLLSGTSFLHWLSVSGIWGNPEKYKRHLFETYVRIGSGRKKPSALQHLEKILSHRDPVWVKAHLRLIVFSWYGQKFIKRNHNIYFFQWRPLFLRISFFLFLFFFFFFIKREARFGHYMHPSSLRTMQALHLRDIVRTVVACKM